MAELNTNLTDSEKQIVQEIIGESKKILFLGIAEFLVSPNSEKEKWTSMVKPGVVCFVKDLNRSKFSIEVISMTEGKIVWNQNIDSHVDTQRRRQWIFVFQTGFRKLMLNFVDDDEADTFSNVLFSRLPEIDKKQISDSTIRYTITERGKVEYEDKMARDSNRQRNIEKILKLAKLPSNVQEADDIRQTIEEVYETIEDYIEEYGSDIFGPDYEEYAVSEEISSEAPTPSPEYRKSESWPNNESSISDELKIMPSRIPSSPPAPSLPPKKAPKDSDIKESTGIPPKPSAKALPPLKISSSNTFGSPPPPPAIKHQPTPLHSNSKQQASSGTSKTKECLLDQIKSGTPLRHVATPTKSCATNEKSKPSGDRGIPDALMDAINKIRMATINSELYGGVDSDDNIYGRW